MENKYKIILSYIQDLSVEIPNPESLITIRNTIPEYQMKVSINSKPSKRKMIEVLTTLSYENPNKKKATGYFQIKYATVIDILDLVWDQCAEFVKDIWEVSYSWLSGIGKWGLGVVTITYKGMIKSLSKIRNSLKKKK